MKFTSNHKSVFQHCLARAGLLTVLLITLSTGCSLFLNGPIKVVIEDIVSPRTHVGELVEVKWSYPGSGPGRQEYVLVQHTITGKLSETFDLDRNDRDLSFIFRAPTTVFIRAFDSSDSEEPESSVAVDIRYATDYKLNATVSANPAIIGNGTFSQALARAYPRLGIPEDARRRRIEFTNFVGMRDENGDHIIDFFALESPGFKPDAPFRMISLSNLQADDYGTIEGSGFPEVCLESSVPERCHMAPDLPESFEIDEISHANALVFGGALAYGGTEEKVKIPDQDEEVSIFRDPVTLGEPIFIVIALHTGPDEPFSESSGELSVVDLYIGNAEQKLAMNVFAGTTQRTAELSGASATYSYEDADDPVISGRIKQSHTRNDLELEVIEEFEARLDISEVEWNVPLRNDNNLLGIPTLTHVCALIEGSACLGE